MPLFDPDEAIKKYNLAPPQPQQAAPSGFDPDAMLKKYNLAPPQEEDNLMPKSLTDVSSIKGWAPSSKGLLSGAVKALPMAGGIAGGAIGSAAGPLGTVGGAGLGAAGGEALKQAIEQQGGLEPGKSIEENLGEIGEAGKQGLMGELGGQILGKAIGASPGLVKRFAGIPAENAAKIQSAADRLGITPTAGQMTGTQDVKTLESALSQSPTIAGGKIAQQVQVSKKGLQEAAEGLVADRESASPFELGEKLKDAITAKIGEKLAPLKMQYDELKGIYQNSPLNPDSLKKTANGLRNLDIAEFPQTDSGQIVHRYADMIENAKNAQSLRTLESEANKAMRSAQSAGNYNEVYAYSKVTDALKRAQQSHILRSAIDEQGKNAGSKFATDAINTLKSTNKGYKALMNEAQDLAGAAGIKAKSPTQFLDALEDLPSEQLSQRMFNTGKYKQLMDVKNSLPDEFESLRKAKLDDIAKKSTIKGVVDPNKLLNNMKSLPKEARTVLFGDKADQAIDDIQTMINASPEMVGPSGTPKGLAWMNLFSPGHYAREVSDAMKYSLLKNNNKISGLVEAGKQYKAPGGLGAGVGLVKER